MAMSAQWCDCCRETVYPSEMTDHLESAAHRRRRARARPRTWDQPELRELHDVYRSFARLLATARTAPATLVVARWLASAISAWAPRRHALMAAYVQRRR